MQIKRALVLLVLLSTAPAALAGQPAPAPLKVTYLANEGFLVSAGGHAVLVDAGTVFANGATPPGEWTARFDCATIDLRLKEGTAAVDAGEVLPGFNDDYQGQAPDLGAYELGSPLPQYGPRPEK